MFEEIEIYIFPLKEVENSEQPLFQGLWTADF